MGDYHFVELSDCKDLDDKYAQIKGTNQWGMLREKYKAKKEVQLGFRKDNKKKFDFAFNGSC